VLKIFSIFPSKEKHIICSFKDLAAFLYQKINIFLVNFKAYSFRCKLKLVLLAPKVKRKKTEEKKGEQHVK